MVAMLILIALVLIAAVTDAARHRIYNWTTYPGILAGLALALTGAIWETASPDSAARWQSTIGWIPLSDALLGLLACGALMIPCFLFFGAGGGDVKLLMMIGAFVGLQQGLEVLLWTFLIAGCLALVVLIWKLGAWTVLVRAWQLLVAVLTLGLVLRLPSGEQQTLRAPVVLAPCVPLAILATMLPWPGLR